MNFADHPQSIYFVYMIKCNDHSFYTGLTTDLVTRFAEHCDGKYPACYTFKRRPLKLVYYETIPFLQDAIDREAQIKGWSRAKKIALIKQDYHKLQLLAECNNLSHSKYKELRKL